MAISEVITELIYIIKSLWSSHGNGVTTKGAAALVAGRAGRELLEPEGGAASHEQ